MNNLQAFILDGFWARPGPRSSNSLRDTHAIAENPFDVLSLPLAGTNRLKAPRRDGSFEIVMSNAVASGFMITNADFFPSVLQIRDEVRSTLPRQLQVVPLR